MQEFERSVLLLGEDAFKKLQSTSVMVFGVGGVGSHCIEALVRGGVGRVIIVDHDVISASNINRQSMALHSTLGQKKIEAMKAKLKDINPSLEVQTYDAFILNDDEDPLQGEEPSYIVDAIDTVSGKIRIISCAKERNIPIISCMGTGNKVHPELFEFAKLEKTSVCPLCKVMRKELKNRGIFGVKVLYSKEQPIDVSKRVSKEMLGNKRSIPGSVSFVPPIAGIMIAGEVIRNIIG